MYHFEKLDTPQKVFDYVVKKVYDQGCKSTDSVSCMYRGPDGNKCAIGHLIPSNLYREEFEGLSLAGGKFLPMIKSERFRSFLITNMKLLSRLQRAHDNANNTTFRSSFHLLTDQIASDYNLQP